MFWVLIFAAQISLCVCVYHHCKVNITNTQLSTQPPYSLTVTWSPPAFSECVEVFSIRLKTTTSEEKTIEEILRTNSYTLRNLQPCQYYQVGVLPIMYNETGYPPPIPQLGDWSTWIHTTCDISDDVIKYELDNFILTSTSLKVHWSEIQTDPTRNPAGQQVLVKVEPVQGVTHPTSDHGSLIHPSTLYALVEELQPCTAYRVTICTVFEGGQESDNKYNFAAHTPPDGANDLQHTDFDSVYQLCHQTSLALVNRNGEDSTDSPSIATCLLAVCVLALLILITLLKVKGLTMGQSRWKILRLGFRYPVAPAGEELLINNSL